MSPKRTDLHMCVSTLIADPFTFDGDTFDAVVDASVQAGCAGISLWSLHHFMAKGGGRTDDQLAAHVRDAGLEVSCIEAIAGWANAASADAALADAEPNFAIAQLYGAEICVAVLLDSAMNNVAQTAANLTAMADRAAESDITIAIEYLPWTGIDSIGTCWDLIQRADRPNIGICFDSWHWHHQAGSSGPKNTEILLSIPGERIPLFQLCDAEATHGDDPIADCMARRPLPGKGAVDHDALFKAFAEIGTDPVIAPEVFNAELLQTGPANTAAEITKASRQVLQRWP